MLTLLMLIKEISTVAFFYMLWQKNCTGAFTLPVQFF